MTKKKKNHEPVFSSFTFIHSFIHFYLILKHDFNDDDDDVDDDEKRKKRLKLK